MAETIYWWVFMTRNPSYSDEWNDPKGVPISAFLFGARRANVIPLVYEAFNWQHGVYLGATMASETTAAATGKVGVLRRDPFAMLPFCGYNMADYFGHWLEIGKRLKNPPRVYRVNWFNRGDDGKFLWPGFGENLRVLQWVIDRCRGRAKGVESPIGYLPDRAELNTEGLSLPDGALDRLLAIDREGWTEALHSQSGFFARFGTRLPKEMRREHDGLRERLKARGRGPRPMQSMGTTVPTQR